MAEKVRMSGGHDAPQVDVPDIADMPIEDLLKSDGSALDNALRRLVGEQEPAPGHYAAFGSSL